MKRKRKDDVFNLFPNDCTGNIIKYLDYNTIVDFMSCCKGLWNIFDEFLVVFNLEAKKKYVKVQHRLNYIKYASFLGNHNCQELNTIINGIGLELELKEKYKKWGLKLYKMYNEEGYLRVKFTLFKKRDFIFRIDSHHNMWFRVYHKGKCYGICMKRPAWRLTEDLNDEKLEFIESQVGEKKNIVFEQGGMKEIIKANTKKVMDNMKTVMNLMNVNMDFTFSDLYQLLFEMNVYICEESICE
jgi:hypothetical protein